MNGKVVILGAGESGVGAALLAQAKGFDVFVSDAGTIKENYRAELEEASIQYEEKQHTEALIFDADTIVKSPGIPDTVDMIVRLREQGIAVISEIEFAAQFTNAKFIAITGSNGKTTTTLLTYHLVKSAGYKVGLAGNIGVSLARQVIEDKYDHYVLEVSSFQLDGMYNFKADVAVLLNITPDHLDRYDNNFDQYIDSKFRITQNMTSDNYFISYIDDPVLKREVAKRDIDAFKLGVSIEDRMLNGAYVGAGADSLLFNVNNHFTKVFKVDLNQLVLTGKHNLINTMCAVLAATAVGVNEAVILKSLGTFKNAPHRLEEVAMFNRVTYINDSKATNVDSVKYALDSFERPIIWIAGGVDKGNDYDSIHELVYEKVTAIICLGKDNTKLRTEFGDKVPLMVETEDVSEAVKMANELSNREGVVLLSPACASFDLFDNYEDRGNKFKSAVKSMVRSHRSTLNFITL